MSRLLRLLRCSNARVADLRRGECVAEPGEMIRDSNDVSFVKKYLPMGSVRRTVIPVRSHCRRSGTGDGPVSRPFCCPALTAAGKTVTFRCDNGNWLLPAAGWHEIDLEAGKRP